MQLDFFRTFLVLALIMTIGWLYWRSRQQGGQMKSGSFTNDLTSAAKKGQLDSVVGRDIEIDRIIQIIARKNKNNPLLIGPAGVGKTAIIEGLAQRIADGDVPDFLRGKHILSLHLQDVLAGTAMRGELEQRLQALLKELENKNSDAILFIDELHMLHQAKGVEGGLNVSDMLKPALARGELAIIGATTWDEYEQSLQKDPAIDRRFQPVLIGEPSEKVAIQMIRGLKHEYEEHHQVSIEDEAIVTAVKESLRRLKKRVLPDKALDLIDEAAAKVSIEATREHTAPLGVLHAASDKVGKGRKSLDQTPVVTSDDVLEVLAHWEKMMPKK